MRSSTTLTDRKLVPAISSMEDRKRAIPHDTSEDSAPPLKRHATNPSSSSQLPQSQDDVIHFQKEAIFRQMLEYKRERSMLQHRVDTLAQQSTHHDEHLRIVDAWWDQLLDEVRLLAGNVEESGKAYEDSESSPFPTALMFEDVESFSEHLSNKRNDILYKLTALFKSIASHKSVPDHTTQLQAKLAKSLAAEKVYRSEIEQLEKEKEEANSRLTEATIKYMTAEKKMDRMRSQTVLKIERQAQSQPELRKETADDAGKDANNESNVTDGQFADVDRARKEAVAVAAKQRSHLDQLQRDNARLSEQITNLTLKLGRLSEEDISSSDTYKNLKVKLEDVVTRFNHLEAENSNLRKATEKLEAERTEFKENLLKEQQLIINDLQNQLMKAEQDLTRIRFERNELHEQMNKKVREEQKLLASKESGDDTEFNLSRISVLEAEIQRLKLELDTNPQRMEVDSELSNVSREDLIERYNKLEKQYELLQLELPGLEKAYKLAVDVRKKKEQEMEEQKTTILKITAEKKKADEKYFTAARSRDTLQSENRVLKNQNSKSSEIIAQLKDAEKSTAHLMINLEKQLAEMRNIHASLIMKNKDQETKLSEQNNSIEFLKRQVGDLTSAIKSRDGALAKESSAKREAELEAEKLRVRLDGKSRELEAARNMRSDNANVESLRRIALCPVCSIRWKEIALRSCGHVHCKECTDERISSRSRKCPSCNRAFAVTDMFRVFLGID